MIAEVLTLFLLNILFLLFATVAFVIALKISRFYDINATTQEQYSLEKKSYLGATVVKYIFYIKIPLFIFFIFILEKLSLILPGAMCATGVVNASEYGIYLLILKLINIYFFAYWIFLHREDMHQERTPFMRLKFGIFIILYFLLLSEIVLEALFFFSIDVEKLVDCCGVVFSSSDGTYMARLIGAPFWMQAFSLYFLFFTMLAVYILRYKKVFAFMNVLFLVTALVTLVGAFSPYVYELPTHHCPFCLLADDYNYVGYLLYVLLFVGTLCGTVLALLPLEVTKEKSYYSISLFTNALYVCIVSYYVLFYYLKNSVLF